MTMATLKFLTTSLLDYKASKDILVYQVQYLADSALEFEEDGLGYEQGVLIRSTDDL